MEFNLKPEKYKDYAMSFRRSKQGIAYTIFFKGSAVGTGFAHDMSKDELLRKQKIEFDFAYGIFSGWTHTGAKSWERENFIDSYVRGETIVGVVERNSKYAVVSFRTSHTVPIANVIRDGIATKELAIKKMRSELMNEVSENVLGQRVYIGSTEHKWKSF